MRPDRRPTPTQVIAELLLNHPEAASMLAGATHWRTLAVWSAATACRKSAAAQAARLAYEELGYLFEPRRRHPVHLVTGLMLLFVLSAGLVLLDLIELGGLRSVGAYPSWPDAGRRAVFGALAGALILVLTAGAATLMARLEPARLLAARRRWYRARAACEAATETEQADAQAAAVARASWLGLVRARVTAVAPDDDDLVQATIARAVTLVGNDRPQLPPAD